MRFDDSQGEEPTRVSQVGSVDNLIQVGRDYIPSR